MQGVRGKQPDGVEHGAGSRGNTVLWLLPAMKYGPRECPVAGPPLTEERHASDRDNTSE